MCMYSILKKSICEEQNAIFLYDENKNCINDDCPDSTNTKDCLNHVCNNISCYNNTKCK